MGHRTDRPPERPTPAIPEPSYAQQVIGCMAAELERTGNHRDLITDITLRRMFTVAVAAKLHQLPTPVADEVASKVADRLPDPALTITLGDCITRLRETAEALR
jgi:hypothetical protein